MTGEHDEDREPGIPARAPLGRTGRFFEDAAVLDELGHSVFPAIVTARAPIRMWVPGCSAGEEVYSLVIVLLEVLHKDPFDRLITVFGTDVDPQKIDAARRGAYGADIARDVSPSRLERFFVKTDAGYNVRRELRDVCNFAHRDFLQNPALAGMDLASLRGLPPDVGQRARPLLQRAVRAGGFALLRATESAGPLEGFRAIDAWSGIFVRVPRADSPRPAPRKPFAGLVATLRARNHDAASLNEELTVVNAALAAAKDEAEAQVAGYQEKLRAMAFDDALAEERERRRIAADLHDHIGQSLALAQIKLSGLRDALGAEAQPALAECLRLIEQSITETRTLTFELSPPILYDLGLKAALGWLGDRLAERHGLAVSVEGEGDTGLDPEVASLLFRVVRELLMNVVKHAETPHARVALSREGDQLVIEVEDGGVGFDADVDAHTQRGFGLFSVREQGARLGGTVEIVSARGEGTRVRLRIPVRARAAPSREGSRGGE